MLTFGEGIRATKVQPITALKIFMFFFVGGLVGLGHLLIGGSPSLVPLVIVLAGLGAVACVKVFVRPSQQETGQTEISAVASRKMQLSSTQRPEYCHQSDISDRQAQ
jgi:hypothetical protein